MSTENDKFPLHTACRQGATRVAEGLIKNDPTLAKKKDDDGRFPIHWAVSSSTYDIVLLLANLRDFDPDAQDDIGWTPLMIAASLPDSEAILKLLIQRGAWVDEKNNAGQTALHFVASKKNLDFARLLLDNKPSASTRVRDRRGQYPRHRAAAVGSVPMVQLLVNNRSPVNAADSEGYTPLHHAIAEGQGDTAVALLKAGADATIKTPAEELPLDLAPDKEVRKYILQGAEREGIEM